MMVAVPGSRGATGRARKHCFGAVVTHRTHRGGRGERGGGVREAPVLFLGPQAVLRRDPPIPFNPGPAFST
jgi:hypothetical protein